MIRLIRRQQSRGRRSAQSKWKQALKANSTSVQRNRLRYLAEVAYQLSIPALPQDDENVVPPELANAGSRTSDGFFKWAWGEIRHDRDIFGPAPVQVYKAVFHWWNHHIVLRQVRLQTSTGGQLTSIDAITMEEAYRYATHWREHARTNWRDDLTLAPLVLSTPVLTTKHGTWFEIQDPWEMAGNSYPEPNYPDRRHPDVAIATEVGRGPQHCYTTHPSSFWSTVSAQGHPNYRNDRFLYQFFAHSGTFLGALSVCKEGCTLASGEEYTREGGYIAQGHHGCNLDQNQSLSSKPQYWVDYWGLLEHIIPGITRELPDGSLYIPKEGRDTPWLGDEPQANWHANHPFFLKARRKAITEWMAVTFAPESELWTIGGPMRFNWLQRSWDSFPSTLPQGLRNRPLMITNTNVAHGFAQGLTKNYPPQIRNGEIYIPVEAILPSWWPARAATLLEEARKVAVMDLRLLPKGKVKLWPRLRGAPRLPTPSLLRNLPIPREGVPSAVLKSPGRSGQHFIVFSPDVNPPDFNRVAKELMENYFDAAVIAWKAQYRQAGG